MRLEPNKSPNDEIVASFKSVPYPAVSASCLRSIMAPRALTLVVTAATVASVLVSIPRARVPAASLAVAVMPPDTDTALGFQSVPRVIVFEPAIVRGAATLI